MAAPARPIAARGRGTPSDAPRPRRDRGRAARNRTCRAAFAGRRNAPRGRRTCRIRAPSCRHKRGRRRAAPPHHAAELQARAPPRSAATPASAPPRAPAPHSTAGAAARNPRRVSTRALSDEPKKIPPLPRRGEGLGEGAGSKRVAGALTRLAASRQPPSPQCGRGAVRLAVCHRGNMLPSTTAACPGRAGRYRRGSGWSRSARSGRCRTSRHLRSMSYSLAKAKPP